MQTMVTVRAKKSVGAESLSTGKLLTHLGDWWWWVGRSKVGCYNGVGDDMDDGGVESASQDRILLSAKRRRWVSFRLFLNSRSTHPVCDTQITASTSLKHPLSILLPQISAMLPSPNSEWSVKTTLTPNVRAWKMPSIPSALREACACSTSICSRRRMLRT